MRRSLVLFAGVFALPLLAAAPAHACDCHDGGLACEAYWKAPVIFVGRVESVTVVERGSGTGARIRNRFRVAEMLRGSAATAIDIFTANTSCDLQFSPGQDWVIYAFQYGPSKQLSTSTCSRSRPLHSAADDLDYARSLRTAPPKARILGTVFYRGADGGVPVKGARLSFQGPSASPLSAVTGADGAFEVVAPAGVYRVSTTLPPGMFGRPTASLVNLVNGHACAQVDVFAEYPATVTGRVVDSRSAPVRDLTVELIRLDQYQVASLRPRARTDAAGQFVIGGVEPGRYSAAILVGHERDGVVFTPTFLFSNGARTREGASPLHVREGTTVAAGTMTLPATIQVGRIDGVVQFNDGKPVAGAKVAMKIDVDDDDAPWTTIATDHTGRFTFNVVAGLTYRVVTYSPTSSATQRTRVPVDRSKQIHAVRVVLP